MEKAKKCILVGWDGADWLIAKPLLEAGRLPQLQAMIDNGVSGDLLSMPPYISPMLWNTIATGKHPHEHGVSGFVEYNESTNKLEPFQSHQRKCKALWNILSQQEKKSHVIGWFASHPAEKTNGVSISEQFGSFEKNAKEKKPSLPGSVYPQEKKARYDELRVGPAEVDSRLLEFFIPEVTSILIARDKRPQQLLARLSELYSYHNAAIETVESGPFDFLAVYFHFIDWVCHDFIIYSAPQRPEVSNRDFQLYRHVVDRAYELQDILLRDLLSRAGPDCACLLLSDHGFASGDARPRHTPKVDSGIAAWHRPKGVIAMAGPGIARGAQLKNAKLLDVAPTLLHYYDLAAGKDMPGQVLLDCFSEKREPRRLASWEGMPPALEHFRADPVAASEKDAFVAHFAALGYLDLESENASGVHHELRATNAWNMGQALFNSARPLEALPYLEEAFYYRPEQVHLAEPLARCQLLLGLTDEALTTCESLRDYADSYPNIALKLVDIYRLAGQVDVALELLQQAADNGLPPATVAFHRGLCHMRNGEHQKALQAYEAAQTAEESMLINLAKASSLIGLERYGDAESLVDSALANGFISADAYFYKGQILAQTDDQREAQLMFVEALKIDPNYLNARIGFSRRELEILRRDGELKPYMAEHFDFNKGGTVVTQAEKSRLAFIAKVRAESAKRHMQWENQIRAHRAKELYSIMLDKSTPSADTSKPIIIVTGLPRSGTSLMMQMLAAAGISVQTDAQRTADISNPKGYFEWEPIKSLAKNPDIITQACGKAVKVVSYQLRHLPKQGNYKIIWMDRPIGEIAQSQKKMLQVNRTDTGAAKDAEISIESLEGHRDTILNNVNALAQRLGTTQNVMRVNYHECLQYSEQVAAKITSFLELPLEKRAAIIQTVDQGLWHSREESTPSHGAKNLAKDHY